MPPPQRVHIKRLGNWRELDDENVYSEINRFILKEVRNHMSKSWSLCSP